MRYGVRKRQLTLAKAVAPALQNGKILSGIAIEKSKRFSKNFVYNSNDNHNLSTSIY